MANHIAGVAKLLGVEAGEVFQIDKDPTLNGCVFRFSNNDLQLSKANGDNGTWVVANDNRLLGLLYGSLSIRKLPWKPTNEGGRYYTPALDTESGCYTVYWENDDTDKRRYRRGLVFKTREEAIAVSKKMLDILEEVRGNE